MACLPVCVCVHNTYVTSYSICELRIDCDMYCIAGIAILTGTENLNQIEMSNKIASYKFLDMT